jgi:hypothetical protein
MGYGITMCEEQNPEMPIDGNPYVWYVVCAWEEAKVWCGTEFGFGDYDPGCYSFFGIGPCWPDGQAGIEIATDMWPGPNQGTAMGALPEFPWNGNFVPVYNFMGLGYSTCIIPVSVDPPTDFCGWGNCDSPPIMYACDLDKRGGMGIGMYGIYACYGTPPPPEAACCIDYECMMYTQEECDMAGGVFYPEDDCEEPDPCGDPPPPVEACCIDYVCYMFTQEECDLAGGVYYPGDDCEEPDPCGEPPPPTAACCIGCDCFMMTQEECDGLGGIFYADDDCEPPDPCEQYTPVESTSWGAIKAIYR